MTSTAHLEAFRIFIYGSDAAPALLTSDSDRHGLNLYIYILHYFTLITIFKVPLRHPLCVVFTTSDCFNQFN